MADNKTIVPGLTPSSVAAGLFGMLLTAIGTQYFEIVISLGFLSEHTLAIPAIWAMILITLISSMAWITARFRLLTRAEMLCVVFMMLISAPLMTQGFWHRVVAVIATNPRESEFGRLDAMNDKLWPHGPNLLGEMLSEKKRATVATQGNVKWENTQYEADKTVILPVLRNAGKDDVSTLRVNIPAEVDSHKQLVQGEPFMINILVYSKELGPDSKYFCRLYTDKAETFTPVFENNLAPKITFLHKKGFQRVGVYGLKLPPGFKDSLTVEFGLRGNGELTVADPKFFSVAVLEGLYRGRMVVTESEFAKLPPEQRSGLLIKPDNMWSLSGVKYLLSGYIPVRDWMEPIMVWTSFVMLILIACFCFNVLMRKQWMDNERFQMPMGRIAMEMVDDQEKPDSVAPVIWKNKLMWIGLGATFAWEITKAWSFYNPKVPDMALNVSIGEYLSDASWGGMWNGCRFEVVAIFLAIGMFMELNILLSMVVGAMLYRSQMWIGHMAGNTNPAYPWGFHQGIGAFIGYAFIVMFFTRKYLLLVVKTALGKKTELSGEQEAISYRWALIILSCTFIGTAIWAKWMGMTVMGMMIFFVLMLIMGIVTTRIRVECGAPWGYIVPGNLAPFMLSIGGIYLFGPESIIFCFIASFMVCPTVFFLIPGAQMELLEIGHRWQVKGRHLFWAGIIALAGGMVLGGWVFLSNSYALGGSTSPYGWAYDAKTWYFFSYDAAMNQATNNFLGASGEATKFDPSWIAMGLAGAITMALTWLRQIFAGFWFHPVGFILGSTAGGGGFLNYIWGSLLVAWAIRWVVLKFGGAVTVRTKLQPLFIGVFVGAALAYLVLGIHAAYLKSIGIDKIYSILNPA